MSVTPVVLCSLAVCPAEAGLAPATAPPQTPDPPKLEQVMAQAPNVVSVDSSIGAHSGSSAGVPEAVTVPRFSPAANPPTKPVATVASSHSELDQKFSSPQENPGKTLKSKEILESPEFIDASPSTAKNALVNERAHSETAIEASGLEISTPEPAIQASREQPSDLAVPQVSSPSTIANALPEEVAPDFDTDPFWDIPTEDEPVPSEAPEAATEESPDEDVGEIRIIPPAAPQSDTSQQSPIAHLLLRASAFTSSNISGLNQPSPSDVPLTTSAGVRFTPALGPDTHLIATAEAGITRFPEHGASNSDAIAFDVGVHHRLGPSTAAQVGWENRQLFRAGSGEQLLDQNSVNVTLGRQDPLDENLRLDSFYHLKAQFANPTDRSRLSHTLGVNLRYDVAPDVDLALGYQLMLEDYTQQVRFDTIHQIRTSITYQVNQEIFLTGLASYQFGSSSDATINPENLSFGIGLGLNLPLF